MAPIEENSKEFSSVTKKPKSAIELIINRTFFLSHFLFIVAFIFLILFVLETKVKLPYTFLIFTLLGRIGLTLYELQHFKENRIMYIIFNLTEVIGYLVLIYITVNIKNGKSALTGPVKGWVNKCLI